VATLSSVDFRKTPASLRASHALRYSFAVQIGDRERDAPNEADHSLYAGP
jgi:hypothetical protein